MDTTHDTHDTIVIGAGLSGLGCARALHDRGRAVLVVERARSVGGRCATWRLRDQPMDHGVLFFHGSDPEFVGLWDAIPAGRLDGWPHTIEGHGRPCHPDAFRHGERRTAFAGGVGALPRYLAEPLAVQLRANVDALHGGPGKVMLSVELPRTTEAPASRVLTCRTAIVALAGEQAARLLRPLAQDEPEVAAALGLLDMVPAQPCMSIAALYPAEVPRPVWDVYYPPSGTLQLVCHDSAKRTSPKHLALVIQSTPAFARRHAGEPETMWVPSLLKDAAAWLGSFVLEPLDLHPHVWRHARIEPVGEIGAPMLLRLKAGGIIGLVGEAFGRGAGTEAAYLSGRQLAHRILQELEL